MEPTQIRLTVVVNLDPVPGAFHTPESAEEIVQAVLNSSLSQYYPLVIPSK